MWDSGVGKVLIPKQACPPELRTKPDAQVQSAKTLAAPEVTALSGHLSHVYVPFWYVSFGHAKVNYINSVKCITSCCTFFTMS